MPGKFHPNKYKDPNGVQRAALKPLASILQACISSILQALRTQGRAPPDWGIATVAATHKGDGICRGKLPCCQLHALTLQVLLEVSKRAKGENIRYNKWPCKA